MYIHDMQAKIALSAEINNLNMIIGEIDCMINRLEELDRYSFSDDYKPIEENTIDDLYRKQDRNYIRLEYLRNELKKINNDPSFYDVQQKVVDDLLAAGFEITQDVSLNRAAKNMIVLKFTYDNHIAYKGVQKDGIVEDWITTDWITTKLVIDFV